MPSPYASLLRLPAIRRQAIAGVLAQLTQGAASLGIILVVRQATASLAIAGATTAAFTVGAGIARPIQGRLIDRSGPARTVAGSAVLHAGALLALVVLARLHAPAPTFVALGVLAGLGLPPVSASMRVVWGPFSADGDRTAAYSLVTLTQELTILLGPLLLAGLIAVASRSLALAAMTAVGALVFAASVRAARGRAPTEAVVATGVLRSPGMRVVLAITVLLGSAIGALEIATAALATAHRAPAITGVLIAALSVGGLLGGAVYGARRWRAGIALRLVVVLALLTAATGPLVAIDDLALAGLLLFVAGLGINPTLTTTALLVDRHVPTRAAEAFGWLSTSMAAGTGAGTAIAGAVGQATAGTAVPFALAAAASACATLLAAVSRSRLEPEQ